MDCNPSLYVRERWWRRNPPNPPQSTWIIGASSGIGKEMALQLSQQHQQRQQQHSSTTADNHGSLLILSSRNVDALEQVAQECRRQQQHYETNDLRIVCLPLDVTNLPQLESAVQQVCELTTTQQHDNGRKKQSESCSPALDMVVMNAGSGVLSPALETDSNVVQTVLQTNALWPMILTPLLLQHYPDPTRDPPNSTTSAPPQLLITSSIAAKVPVPLSASYAAAKAALHHYFLSLATERPDLVIDLACPGPVDTQFHSNHIQSPVDDHGEEDSRDLDSKQQVQEHPQQASSSSSPLKMPVQRCAQLMLAAAARSWQPRRSAGVQESWICQQPTLTALYLYQWCPSLLRPVLARIGTKRVNLWRRGLDLYNPSSWTAAAESSNESSPKR
uniref:Protochlorophyllide reductase n=1 Tax=Entomoneis paludosa TaxID=265537 RepID=A0A7S2YNY3_9STRA